MELCEKEKNAGSSKIPDELGISSFTNPSSSKTIEDLRINCSNSDCILNIFDVAMRHVSEFADKLNLKEESSEFVNQFAEVFKNALQENITVNGLPWVADKNKLSTPEKEDHALMVDEAVLKQLSKTVACVATKRKSYPQLCSKIIDIKRQNKLLNLKKSKVIQTSPLKKLSPLKQKKKDQSHLRQFSSFCKDFNSMQETTEQQVKESEKLMKKINIASLIKLQQKTLLKSLAADETQNNG